jgi:hypothetical protein
MCYTDEAGGCVERNNEASPKTWASVNVGLCDQTAARDAVDAVQGLALLP